MPNAISKWRYFQLTGYTPHQAQREIHSNTSRFRVLSCGRRFGKTLVGAKEGEITNLVQNRRGDPQRGWIVGPEYSDAEKEFRVIFNSLRDLGYDRLCPKWMNNPDSGNMHIRTRWGWDIQCRSAAHPEKLTGEGLDWVLMVEAGRHKPKTWTEYIRPTLADNRGWAIFSGVPEGATSTSLLYRLWQKGQSKEGRERGWMSWRMPTWFNTVLFRGPNDPEILDAKAELTEDEFARQYEGKFVERVGRVMKEWDDEVHLYDLEYNPKWPLYAAVDYGFTNPFVWLWVQVDNFDNIYIIGEKRWKQRDTQEVAKELKEHPLISNLVAFYPDPAEPDDTKILSRILRKPNRGPTGGELKTRLSLIRQKLKTYPTHIPESEQEPYLRVDRSCDDLAWEMREGYRWPTRKSETREDSETPMKKDDHGPEALGRFMRGYFGLPGPDESKQGTKISKARMRR